MISAECYKLINITGLILNLSGVLLLVFYIRTDPNEWIENEAEQKSGEKWHTLYVKHPQWLTLGITLVAAGSLLNIIAELVE